MANQLLPAYLVLPAQVVDQHLATASGVYWKVLLAVTRRDSMDVAALAQWLSLPESDVREALQYWIAQGVLPGGQPAAQAPVPARQGEAPPRHRLTAQELSQRTQQSEQLRFVFQTAEGIYGRPLTDTERRGFVYFLDDLGLPPDVVVMAVDFCVTNGKLHFNYLQKLCVGWAQQEINTHALAEEYIREQTRRWSNERQVQEAFGIQNRGLTAENKKFISQWFYQFGFNIQMIQLAYERAVDKIGRLSFPYIHKILQSWYQNDLRTPEDVAERDQPPVRMAARTQAQPSRPASSYDPEEFDRRGFDLPPLPERREDS